MIQYLVSRGYGNTLQAYLDSPDWSEGLDTNVRIVEYDSLASAETLPLASYVFSDLDRLSAGQREFAAALWDALSQSPTPMRCLNDPRRAKRRYDLLRDLHAAGLNDFQVRRPSESLEDLRFPVFVREENAHTGALTELLNDSREVESALALLVARGYHAQELLVIEYRDVRSPDGLYRKYAAFCVAGTIIPRSLSSARRWVVKFHDSELTAKLIEQERDYVLGNPHEKWLREVFAASGIDYGRVDYAVVDGRPLIWEINLNPTVGPRRAVPRGGRPDSPYRAFGELRRASKRAFGESFHAALRAIDTPGVGAGVRLELSPEARRAARGRIDAVRIAQGYRRWLLGARRSGWFRGLRRVFGPALLAVIARARRFQR